MLDDANLEPRTAPLGARRRRAALAAIACAAAACAAACGGAETPPAQSPGAGPGESSHRPARSGMTAESEIGALDPDRVNRIFSDSLGHLQQCLHSGASRVEFLGGQIAFFIKVGADGRLLHAHAEQSTLGDRETEKCMLDALKSRRWPPPEGGHVGLAQTSFDFDMPNDVRPPTPWDGSEIGEAVGALSAELNQCKQGTPGAFVATMYVDTEGTALAVGIAPPSEEGEPAVDCLAEVLKSATYPSPGSWPAKVTFSF